MEQKFQVPDPGSNLARQPQSTDRKLRVRFLAEIRQVESAIPPDTCLLSANR
jgi:hypothetical protein